MLKNFIYVLYVAFDLVFYASLCFLAASMIHFQFELPMNWFFILYDIILISYTFIIPKMLGFKWYMSAQDVGENYRYFGGFILIALSLYYIFYF